MCQSYTLISIKKKRKKNKPQQKKPKKRGAHVLKLPHNTSERERKRVTNPSLLSQIHKSILASPPTSRSPPLPRRPAAAAARRRHGVGARGAGEGMRGAQLVQGHPHPRRAPRPLPVLHPRPLVSTNVSSNLSLADPRDF